MPPVSYTHLASLSHDIRTPLMGAKGYLRLAQDEGDEAGRDRRLAAAEARLDDMGALLDQLFAYAQANDPDLALDLVPVAVLPALADVLVGQFPAFERRGCQWALYRDGLSGNPILRRRHTDDEKAVGCILSQRGARCQYQ